MCEKMKVEENLVLLGNYKDMRTLRTQDVQNGTSCYPGAGHRE
jgi:hypothetical protein